MICHVRTFNYLICLLNHNVVMLRVYEKIWSYKLFNALSRAETE